MFVLRQIFALAVAAGVIAATAVSAEAGSPCNQGPPAWWNAPRVTYLYNGHRVRSYDDGASYSRRAYSSRSTSTRSSYRSYSSPRYAHSRGYTEWR